MVSHLAFMANSSKPSSIDVTVSSDTGFVRELGPFDSVMMVVGVMIGSGIFILSTDISRQIGITERPNEVWATDNTATVTFEEGQVTMFVAVDNCTTECVGIPEARRATHFEALEPIRQEVRDHCGGAQAAAGLRLRHDHVSQYMSDDIQAEIAFLGIESSLLSYDSRKEIVAWRASSGL